MTIEKTLRARWKGQWSQMPAYLPLERMFDTALGLGATVAAKKAEIAKPGHYSPKGVVQALRDHLSQDLAGTLRGYQTALAAAEEAILSDRTAMGLPTFDKNDMMGELQRQEIRAWLRGMDPATRVGTLMAPGNVEVLKAALGAQPALSGISPELVERLQGHYAETTNPDGAAELEERAEALMLARMALEGAVGAVCKEVELDPYTFDQWLENPDTLRVTDAA